MISTGFPASVHFPMCASTVEPGKFAVFARSPQSRLKSEVFPTFGFPTIAMRGIERGGELESASDIECYVQVELVVCNARDGGAVTLAIACNRLDSHMVSSRWSRGSFARLQARDQVVWHRFARCTGSCCPKRDRW